MMKFSSNGVLITGKNMVVADLHLGILGFPDFSMLDRLIEIYDKSKASRLVINGDVKHMLWKAELTSVQRFISDLREFVSELVIVKGNHDGYLSQITETHNFFRDGKNVFAHGHRKFEEIMNGKRIILAHTHPAIFIHNRVGGAKERAWLHGRIDDKECIVMPAFNEYCSSTAVNLEKPAGFIFRYMREFEVFTIDGFYFGRVRI